MTPSTRYTFINTLQIKTIQWLMPSIWTELNRLADAYREIKSDNTRLFNERADMTEVALSLVARDDDGHFTTVFDADTQLPAEYSDMLSAVVAQA